MLKVICVSREDVRNRAIPQIEIGDELIVEQKIISPSGRQCYIFVGVGPIIIDGEEWPCAYMSKNFAILPDQSADEMQQETKEAIVNLEPI